MNYKDIKPIPKYIEKRIRALDLEKCPQQKGLRFYAYLTTIKKELVKITVAMRNKGKKVQLMKQVAVHGVYSDQCLVRDLEYCYLGIYAYRVGWYDEGIKYTYDIRPRYNDGIWYSVDFKYYNPYAPLVNKKLAVKIFPYAALQLYDPACVIAYLRTYLKYPQTEYLIKLGLSKFVYSEMILERVGKDRRFCKWLIANRQKLSAEYFYISTILRAYKTGKPLNTLQAYAEAKIRIRNRRSLSPLRKAFRRDMDDLIDYIGGQNTNMDTYHDYFRACNYLGLDMTIPKNRFPYDFKRWHDIRIDEYATAVAQENERQKAELIQKFASVAEKYSALQYDKQNVFICLIARSPYDLIREGNILHHCVGRMNYDQRFIREESLIFFIRTKDAPTVPFVTVEYSLSQHRILQCYGEHDTKPDERVLEFVNRKWLPFANRQLKKIQIAA
ncbi:MAG: PcfJ domain-containing protein [Lachnospiraceae bacterium]|nr:PcfJ domain-containing protein [Lachnospiraceae bacterium]